MAKERRRAAEEAGASSARSIRATSNKKLDDDPIAWGPGLSIIAARHVSDTGCPLYCAPAGTPQAVQHRCCVQAIVANPIYAASP